MNSKYQTADDLDHEPEPLPGSTFGVDKHINVETIDEFLEIEDVAYRDMRLLEDTAHFEDIGGERDLTQTVEGFEVVPYPYIATIGLMPVADPYRGPALFSVDWKTETELNSIKANYEESLSIVEELFPKDQTIFLMCGGAGYSGMMKAVLVALGWDEDTIYNIGACWKYRGTHGVQVVEHLDDGSKVIHDSVEVAKIDLDSLTPVK